MANRKWPLCLAWLTVLFTSTLVAGVTINIDENSVPGQVLLTFGRPGRTNYRFLFSPALRILRDILNIDSRTGIIRFKRPLSCGIPTTNRIFIVTLGFTSTVEPTVHFREVVTVSLKNRRCLVERGAKLLSGNLASASNRKLISGRRKKNKQTALVKRLLQTGSVNRRRFSLGEGRSRTEQTENTPLLSLGYNGAYYPVSDSRALRKTFKKNAIGGFQEDRLRIKRSIGSNPPKFAKSSDTVSVKEDVKIGSVVFTVSASDPNRRPQGVLFYAMTPMGNINSKDFFQINSSSGEIHTMKELDRETMAKHVFRVTATNKGGSRSSQATMVLTILVLDVNDHSPVFDKKVYTANISEAEDVDFTVLAVRAYDSDSGVNKEIRYKIVNNDGVNRAFVIGHGTGIIRVNQKLDREKVAFYNLTVMAEDQGKPVHNSTAQVYVTLLDDNDCAPVFNESMYEFSVPENSRRDSVVDKVNATDCDTGLNKKIRYSITSGNDDQAFYIITNSGVIHVKGKLDYEKKSVYSILVTAEDYGEIPEYSEVWVQISITDINDNPPEFPKDRYEFKVREDVGIGDYVGKVRADDYDSGQNGKIDYFLKQGNFPFKIEKNTGKIKTNAKLDREQVSSYQLEVIAQDKGENSLRNAVNVYIIVLDVNDSPPYFTKSKYNATIPEKYPPLRSFLTVTAKDKDLGGTLTYTVKDVPENCFSINRQYGGIIKTRTCKLDYKRNREYHFNVVVSDGVQNSSTEVVISISDSNDNSPRFEKSTYTGTIYENQPAGTTILQVNATDEDFGENARLTYSIYRGSKVFKIDPTTGVITSLISLDREVTAKYRFRVIATDNGKRKKSGKARVSIKVKDMNDNVPKFMQDFYEVSLQEDVHVGTFVLQVKATDKDDDENEQITYFLEDKGNKGDMFKIHPILGDITVNKELDRETTASYTLMVVATDHGSPSLNASTRVKVLVEDVIDSPPVFVKSRYVTEIREDAPKNHEVEHVKAVSNDTKANGQIQYDITNGNYDKKFTISGTTGIILLAEPLDYEVKTQYILTVQAMYSSFLDSVEVEINVKDVNDMAPVLLPKFDIIINSRLNKFPHGLKLKIPAYDPDKTSQLIYEVKNVPFNVLSVDRSTGILNLKESALSNTVGVNFDVKVSDGRFTKLSQGSIHLNVITKSMLNASVPVYLKNVTASKFFSVFKKFKKFIGSFLGVQENNIVVFNILQKIRTWVEDYFFVNEHYLTVWLAVKQDKFDNMFLDPKLILDLLFLNQEGLKHETGMVFLPTDEEITPGKESNHNVDVSEACAAAVKDHFFTCSSEKSFQDTQSPVLSSLSVLFQGLDIKEVFRKACPPGFHGRLCNFKLDSCYSSPCKNKGVCINFEGGYSCKCQLNYVGKNCEINTKKSKCPRDNICRNKGVCVDVGKSGFVCKCPTVDYFPSQMCSAKTRSFKDGSFVAFPGLTQHWQVDISLEFATIQQNGLLLYVGRFEHKNDTIAVEIRDGKVYYMFSAGNNIRTVSVSPENGESITNSQWHKITISFQNEIGSLVLGEKCNTAVAVKFGNQVGNFSCAVATTLKHEKKVLRSMDLNSPLFLGGLPFKIDQPPIRGKSFDGCIRNVFVNHAPLDLGSPIFNKGSNVGCGPKKDLCYKNPCLNKGKCTTSWGIPVCQCPEGFAGQTCEIKTMPMDFTSNSFVITSPKNNTVNLPWSMVATFRTVQGTGTLIQVTFDTYVSLLQLDEGTLKYNYHMFNMSSPNVRVDDGEWHHVQVTWNVTSVTLVIDHVYNTEVMFQGSILDGRLIKQLTLGDAEKSGNGFSGCMKGVAIGDTLLYINTSTKHLISDGCSSKVKCQKNTCPKHSVCQEKWRRTSCVCRSGFVGKQCSNVCSLNPCQNGATCHITTDSVGFKCICREKYLGQYCEVRSQLPCRDEFYSASDSGLCGPCDCDLGLGYNPVCNKSTGYCHCHKNHYREILDKNGRIGKLCIKCDCDKYGSKSQTCEPIGGQCPCLPGVIGPHCDMCKMKQGEITQTGKGCKIINTSCPRAKAEEILWERVKFGNVAKQKCPYGAQGTAVRICAIGKGWQDPDVTDCTTTELLQLEKFLKRSGNLTTEKAIKICELLGNTYFARKHFFQKDVAIGYRIIMALMEFESRQEEEHLASSQDADFLDTVLKVISRFVDKKYVTAWSLIKQKPPAAVRLMQQLEAFGINLASNIVHIKRNLYRERRATSSLQSLNKFQPNIFMKLEPVDPKHFSGLLFSLEKEYDSRTLVSLEWQNRTNRIEIPASIFENPGAPKQESAIAFIVLKDLAELLPRSYDIRESAPAGATEYSLQVNSDVVIIGIKGMESMYLKDPITIEFENHAHNYSQYECVYWNYSIPGSKGGGWSTSGCIKVPSNTTHTICKCHHLTSFAVVSDLKIEPPVLSRYSMEIITYVGIAVSLALLLFAVLSFTCLSGLNSNTNNIHRSMVLAIVIAELVYLFGINRTSNQLICRFIAIVLHYFFDAVFAWMFVEVIHMYRMLTEKRNIDTGQMTFYYFLGWGSPAIVVGLSTGMAVEGYGNEKFCWMTTSGTLIWTFAIPIVAVMFSNSIVFLMALSLSIKKARKRRKQNTYNPNKAPVTSVYKNALKIKYALKVGAVFLPILAVTLIFAVLAVNEDLLVFHYLFALLCCCQSLFVILFYVAFDPKVREEYKNAFIRWKTGDKNYGRSRRKRLFEKSYHPGSNLAGEEGYGLKGRNPETTSTDRSTSTLHSSSMTRTSKTDPFSTFPESDSDTDFKESKRHRPRKEDPVDMESAAKLWNAPEKSEVSTTQPESSDSSTEGRRRTMIISSDSGSSGEDSGSWEKKATKDLDKQKGTAPLYASDGPMHSTPLELEREKARLLNTPETEKPVEKLPESKLPSILKNNTVSSPRTPQPSKQPDKDVQPSPQSLKTPIVAPKPTKSGSEASSGSSLSSPNDENDDLVLQAKLLSQSTEGGMSTVSSKERKKKSRKTRDMQFGKKSRHQRVHFHRPNSTPNTNNATTNPKTNKNPNPDDGKRIRVKALHLGEGKPLTGQHV